MAGLTETISREVGVPVIEGVSAALKLAEALVGLNLYTSKHGDLDYPRPKAFSGHFRLALPGDQKPGA